MKVQGISQEPSVSEGGTARRVDLDWVRMGAFALLIFYHVGMLYVSWGFQIKSDHRVTALEPLMLVINPWRLSLLFLVSGIATRFMLRKYSVGGLLQARTARLLIPLLFGMFVIVPPQAYDQVVETAGYSGSFFDFYVRHYLAFGPQFCSNPCILLPTWNHLWFVAYLWVYTVALGVVMILSPRLVPMLEQQIASLLSGPWLVILPSILFTAYRLLLLPRFSSTHALLGDWYNHALYASVFLLGFLLAHSDSFWERIERQRWVALSLAAGFFVSFLVVRWARSSGAPASLMLTLFGATTYGAYQWICMVALLGFAKRWLKADSPLPRYLVDAIFPYYIVHQTAIIMIAHELRGRDLPAWLEGSVVIGGTLAICLLTYEIVRRVPLLGPLFGLRMSAPSALPVRAGQPAE